MQSVVNQNSFKIINCKYAALFKKYTVVFFRKVFFTIKCSEESVGVYCSVLKSVHVSTDF